MSTVSMLVAKSKMSTKSSKRGAIEYSRSEPGGHERELVQQHLTLRAGLQMRLDRLLRRGRELLLQELNQLFLGGTQCHVISSR